MDRKKAVEFARNGVIIVVILVGMVWANTYYRGRAQYQLGEQYFKTGDLKNAIAAYGTSVRMYTPFGSYVPKSIDRLYEIGEGYQKEGKYDWALISYRELRSGVYAIRSFYSPYSEWIAKSDERIDESLALQTKKEPPSPPKGGPASANE